MIQLLLLGLAAGFVTSIGIGPLTLTAVSRSIRNGVNAGLAVGAGAAVMDFLVVSILGFGIHSVNISGTVMTIIVVLVGVALIVGGIRRMLQSSEERFRDIQLAIENAYPPTREHLLAHGAVGALLYVANPLFFAVWASVLSILESRGVPVRNPVSIFSFAIGAGAGTFALFWLLLAGVQRLTSRLQLLQRTIPITPFVEIAVGIFIIFQTSFVTGRPV